MHYDDTTSLWSALLARAGAQDAIGPLDIASLRAYVCDFVRAAKARGDSPERVIRELKRDTTPGIRQHATRLHQRLLWEAVFQWCLDEYHGPRAGGTPPAPAAEQSSAPA